MLVCAPAHVCTVGGKASAPHYAKLHHWSKPPDRPKPPDRAKPPGRPKPPGRSGLPGCSKPPGRPRPPGRPPSAVCKGPSVLRGQRVSCAIHGTWRAPAPRPVGLFGLAPQSEQGVLTLSGYAAFWGWAFTAITLAIALLKKEAPEAATADAARGNGAQRLAGLAQLAAGPPLWRLEAVHWRPGPVPCPLNPADLPW